MWNTLTTKKIIEYEKSGKTKSDMRTLRVYLMLRLVHLNSTCIMYNLNIDVKQMFNREIEQINNALKVFKTY